MAATATKNREAAILKGIRAQMGLTQAEFGAWMADKSGDVKWMGRATTVENSKSSLTRQHILDLHEATGADLRFLVYGIGLADHVTERYLLCLGDVRTLGVPPDGGDTPAALAA